MAKVREQTCTISHHDRQCWLHLDTLTQSWALRVMNTEHGKGTTTSHLATFPATPLTTLGSYWHLRPFWPDPHPACQTAKAGPCQNTTHSWRMGSTRTGKGSGKGRGQASHFDPGSSFLLHSKTSYGKEAFTPETNKSSDPAEITEYLCTLPLPDFTWQLQRMHKWEQPTATKHGKYWDPKT